MKLPFFIFNQFAVLASNAWSEIKMHPAHLFATGAVLAPESRNCIEKISADPQIRPEILWPKLTQ